MTTTPIYMMICDFTVLLQSPCPMVDWQDCGLDVLHSAMYEKFRAAAACLRKPLYSMFYVSTRNNLQITSTYKRYVGQESPTQGRKTGLRAHEPPPPPSGHHRQSQKGKFDRNLNITPLAGNSIQRPRTVKHTNKSSLITQ